ncbi:MAG: alpha/beta fold hydrolase [Thermosynechococcaceae cyanobacterium]
MTTARSKLLIKTGMIALLLLLALGMIALLGHRLGVLPAVAPLPHLALFLGTGGLACLLAGWLLSRPSLKKIALVACMIFFSINALAFTGAYALTHSRQPHPLSFGRPKPQSSRTPSDIGLAYTTHRIAITPSEWIETWVIPANQPQGTVLLFPGNLGTKGQQLLPSAQIFHDLNYNAMLVDFRGTGGSSGYATSVGFWEAEDVALAVQKAQQLSLASPLVLYGISMGSAAILRAVAQKTVTPDAIILELPFTRLRDAIANRISAFHLPTFPLTELLVFWGGIQQGFNGFAHSPINYAQQVTCPTLILQGQHDRWISLPEVKKLQAQIRGASELVVFPTAGHQLLVTVAPELWEEKIRNFLAASQS